MTIPINILLNGISLFPNKITKCEIKHDGGVCLSCNIDFANMTHWAACNPVIQYGKMLFKIAIGTDIYWFMCEERQLNINNNSQTFSVWGRSRQAFLTQKFCELINDTEDSGHIWQTQKKTTASAVIQDIIDNYAYSPITVNFNIDDFYIYRDGFTVSNKEPLAVIKEIVEGVGAEIIGNADGSLTIQKYETTGASVCDLNDFDDIIEYSENIQYQSGYNAVTVYGYNDENELENTEGAGSGETSITAAGDTELEKSQWGQVKVYYYAPVGMDIDFYSQEGATCQSTGQGTDSITEDVELSWGQGSTSMPDSAGVTSVTGSSSKPFETKTVTYPAKFKQYKIKADELGEYKIKFWIEDKSAETEHSFTVIEPAATEEEQEDQCAEISAETEINEAVPGQIVDIKVTNPYELPVIADSTAGQSVDAFQSTPDYTMFQTLIPDGFDETEVTITFQIGECDALTITLPILQNEISQPVTPDNPGGVPQPILTAKWTEDIAGAYVGYHYEFRAYGWHPKGAQVIAYSDGDSSVVQTNSGLEPQSESVSMEFGVGETQYPNADGGTIVTASPDYPLDTKTVNYNAPYWEFGFSANSPGTYKILIYFADKSAETELEITVGVKPGEGGTPGTKPSETLYIHWEYDINVPVPGADVWTDPDGDGTYVYAGQTDGDGYITLSNHTYGAHVIRFSKSGWINSDADDLENDTFTIEP